MLTPDRLEHFKKENLRFETIRQRGKRDAAVEEDHSAAEMPSGQINTLFNKLTEILRARKAVKYYLL